MRDWKELQIITDVTLTYSSADAPVFVATTSADLTSSVSLGMRLRLDQSTGGTKYFIVVDLTSSAVTLYGGTDYVLENEAISDTVFSSAKVPFGFPMDPTKWTVELKSSSVVSQASATTSVWYNLGSLSLDIPIGLWRVYWEVCMDGSRANVTEIDMWTTLSTANNSESDTDFTASIDAAGATATIELIVTAFREKYLDLTSKTTFYLNAKTERGNTNLNFHGVRSPTIVRAICAYL